MLDVVAPLCGYRTGASPGEGLTVKSSGRLVAEEAPADRCTDRAPFTASSPSSPLPASCRSRGQPSGGARVPHPSPRPHHPGTGRAADYRGPAGPRPSRCLSPPTTPPDHPRPDRAPPTTRPRRTPHHDQRRKPGRRMRDPRPRTHPLVDLNDIATNCPTAAPTRSSAPTCGHTIYALFEVGRIVLTLKYYAC